MPIGNSGTTRLTSDNPVGASGEPIRLFNVTWLSGGGGAGVLVLRNGISAAGTIYVQQVASAASVTNTISFEEGLLFPGGCWFDKDANVAAVVAEFVEEV